RHIQRRACTNDQLSSSLKGEVVSTLSLNGTRTGAGSETCANRGAPSTSGNRANDRADRGANRRALFGLRRLTGVANCAFSIDANSFAVRRAHAVQQTGELI